MTNFDPNYLRTGRLAYADNTGTEDSDAETTVEDISQGAFGSTAVNSRAESSILPVRDSWFEAFY